MKAPALVIDPPGPFDPPKEWWAFLRRLREFDQNDPAVQAAKEQVLEYLRQAASEKTA